MKRSMLFLAVICAMMVWGGCGKQADENKSIEEIKSELANLRTDEIETIIAQYKQAIEQRSAELKAETDKLAAMSLHEQLGAEAKDIREKMAVLAESIKKLEGNMAVYIEGLRK